MIEDLTPLTLESLFTNLNIIRLDLLPAEGQDCDWTRYDYLGDRIVQIEARYYELTGTALWIKANNIKL